MDINIKTIDARSYKVDIIESAEQRMHEKPTLVRIGNSLEIAGKHEGNHFAIRLRISAIIGFAVDEDEQFATIHLHAHGIQVAIKYAYYKMGKLNKLINHKFKEDIALLEGILAE